MADYPLVSFRIDEQLQKQLQNRTREGELSHLTAKESIERYFALLDRERRVLAGMFTVAELSLMIDSCNGTMFEPHTMHGLSLEITDAVEDGAAEKWDIDGDSLVQRVKSLSPGATWALIDGIERWWSKGDSTLDAAGFMSIGLVPASD